MELFILSYTNTAKNSYFSGNFLTKTQFFDFNLEKIQIFFGLNLLLKKKSQKYSFWFVIF